MAVPANYSRRGSLLEMVWAGKLLRFSGRLGNKGTISRPGSLDWVLAASLRTKIVNGAAAADWVQKNTIPVGHLGKSQGLASGVEVLDEFFFAQSLENYLGGFLKVKLTDQAHANQVAGFHLHRQAAARSTTMVAQLLVKFDPGFKIVHVGGFVGDFHRALLTLYWINEHSVNIYVITIVIAANFYDRPVEKPPPETVISSAHWPWLF